MIGFGGILGEFECDDCEQPGSGPNYHCERCEFDLHIHCTASAAAATQLDDVSTMINVVCPANHEMVWLPSSPYPNDMFRCDGCGQPGSGPLYHCGDCNFDLHMHCTASAAATEQGVVGGAAEESQIKDVLGGPAAEGVVGGAVEVTQIKDVPAEWVVGGTAETTQIEDVPAEGVVGGAAEATQIKDVQGVPLAEEVVGGAANESDRLIKNDAVRDGTKGCCVPLFCTLHSLLEMRAKESIIRCPGHHEMVSLSSPPYPNGEFRCDDCGQVGSGAVYHCGHCNFDLHLHCTEKVSRLPVIVTCPAHHEMDWLPSSPYPSGEVRCDRCSRSVLGSLYHCGRCHFDLHFYCTASAVSQLDGVLGAPAAEGFVGGAAEASQIKDVPGGPATGGVVDCAAEATPIKDVPAEGAVRGAAEATQIKDVPGVPLAVGLDDGAVNESGKLIGNDAVRDEKKGCWASCLSFFLTWFKR
ncbi:uncharacterized protein LOC18432007 [Amborella trichopoda]|nr:uncharacterized protein LOC18432007 [Amborella trichopoda]|eukprot:XP_020521433.1 uncharacterized protein LOC18432007 [Amborella trichopoda]